jgi:hypothetical protein
VPGELIDLLPADQLDVVLAHELAHHRRHDLWVNAVQTLTFVAFWFHPVYWWLTRTIRQVREQCCDDLLLATRLTSADICCDTLLTVACRPASPRTAPVAISMGHPLASRLQRLLDESQKRTSRLSVSGWILTGAAALLIWPGLRLATPTVLRAADGLGATAQPTPSTPVDISGTLMDESGLPIPDADVYLIRRNAFSHRLEDRDTLLRQAQTDRMGHFQITVAGDELDGPLRWGTEIWAFKDGFAVVVAHQSGLKTPSPIKLTARRSSAEFVVVGPDGHPVPDALVSPGYLQCAAGSGDVPVSLLARLSRKTDAAGRVTLPVETRDNVHSLTIECPRFGVQYTTFVDRQRRFVSPPGQFALGDVGKIIGRVKSDNPAAVADLEVRCITSGPQGEHVNYHQVASFTTRTNSKGEFQVPILRAGTLQIDVSENQRFSSLAVPPRDLVVAAGRATTVDVPLRKAVRVTGRAVDRRTMQPVPRVVVAWTRHNREISTTTDAQGQYAFLANSGQMQLRIFPPQLYVPLADFQRVTIRNADSDELPPLLLAKGQTLRGRAVDAAGKPVDDVEVEVSWADIESENPPWGGTHARIGQSGFSNGDGSFAVPAIPADRELQVAARTNGVEVAEPQRLTARPEQPLQLIVRRLDVIDLSGTVLDARQHPIRGATAQIEQQSNAGPNVVTMCIVDKVTTDSQGQFRSTRKFDRQGLYRAQVLVDGQKVAESEWIKPANQPGNQFPALRVTSITVDPSTPSPRESIKSPQNAGSKALATSKLDGTVIDKRDMPVANASVTVWSLAQRRRQQTNDDGRFTWQDIPTEGAFLFVEAKDFRFHGQWIVPGKSAVQIRLSRRNEPSAPIHATADPPVSKELLQRTWRAFQPTLQQLLKQLAEEGTLMGKIWNTGLFDEIRLLELYAEFDRPAALQFIDGHHFNNTWLPDFVRARIAEKIAESSPDDAVRVIDQIKDPHQRLQALCRAATLATNRDASHRGKLLARARSELDHVAEQWQLESLLFLAKTNREIGDAVAAAEFLKQAENRLQRTGPDENRERGNFARGWFAIDKATVMGIDTTGLLGPAEDDFDFNRYRGAIAEAIAARNPATAEQIHTTLRQRQDWTPRICHAMAKADPERAARLARSSAEPVFRAYALGLVALMTAPKERENAIRQLDEAYSVLEQAVEAGESSTLVQTPVSTALAMLEIVEQIDPTLVREYFWRALSLRINTTFGSESMALGPYGPMNGMRLSDPVLAACLARYDDEAALHALRPPGDESVTEWVERYPHWYFFSSAILDPTGTIDIVARLPHETRTQRIAFETAWQDLFASLRNRGEARWDLIREKQMFLWKPGSNGF